jgi:putative spermidine/putrescine transport system substrate-binding protein
MSSISKRKFLKHMGAGLGATVLTISKPWIRRASAAEATLIGVEWGGPWLEGAKQVAAKQTKYDIQWETHAGAAAAIIAKIKTAWPTPLYDFVAQFDPLYYAWLKEGWPEPLSLDEMPNLRDIPEEIFVRNDKGQVINVPISHSGRYWGYRSDKAPFPIKKHEDLLDPRLKGQICVPYVLQSQNSMVAMFALAYGGNEKNMEPGWEFMRKLAKTGNIGRVAKTEVDFINSLSSGECSVGIWSNAAWAKISQAGPCVFLNRVPGDKVFRTGLLTEGFMIPSNSTKKKEAKDFLNFFASAENLELYNKALNFVPPNPKSGVTKLAENIVFKTSEERKEFAIGFDFVSLGAQQNEMNEKWEKEITPLIR